jgi:hypothetical protein
MPALLGVGCGSGAMGPIPTPTALCGMEFARARNGLGAMGAGELEARPWT